MVEYNGLLLEMLTAHEVAHQWFFGVVGSDQVRDPWLDEGMVNAVALDYFRQRSGKDYQELWDGWGNYTVPGYLNRSIYEFRNGTTYFDEVYRRGATFALDLETMVKPEVFYRTLREYYAENQFGIATAGELLARMRAASSTDPLSLYQRTFDYPFLSAPNPTITLSLPSGIMAGSVISVPVAASDPGSRLRASLDGAAVPVVAGASRVIVVRPSPGDHTLLVEAFGPGVGFASRAGTFSAATPAPTATPVPTAALRPTAAPQAPLPLPLPPTALVRDREAAWLLIAVLGLSGLAGTAAAAIRLVKNGD